MKKPLTDIEHSIYVEAAPAVVWDSLTAPKHVPQWLGCLRYEKAIGHVFYMQQDDPRRADDDTEGATHCRILSLDEPHGFAFSWYLPGMPETRVDITLHERESGTEVVLTHSGWGQFDASSIRSIRDALEGGWGGFVLPRFREVVEDNAK